MNFTPQFHQPVKNHFSYHLWEEIVDIPHDKETQSLIDKECNMLIAQGYGVIRCAQLPQKISDLELVAKYNNSFMIFVVAIFISWFFCMILMPTYTAQLSASVLILFTIGIFWLEKIKKKLDHGESP